MLPSAEDALSQITQVIEELEGWVCSADGALSELRWDAVAHAFAEQRRVTHALTLLLQDYAPKDAPARAEIDRRLRAIGEFRDRQLERLRAYNASIGKRLTVVARFKGATRSMGSARPSSTLANLDQLR